jgi:hypothetical protein
MREFTPENITSLKENEVFVFGSNASGFHGAGSAGMAYRGVAANTWRDDLNFNEALNSPLNSPKRVGNWAVLGQARGFQKGKNGCSYAVETIKRPGLKRSTSLEEITEQLQELKTFAKTHPEFKFLVTKIGSFLAGYSVEEIKSAFIKVIDFPNNIILPQEYEFRD